MKEEAMQNSEQRQNNFGHGFILGLLFGVALTLLLVTKKGRQILTALTEDGLDSIGELKARLKHVENAANDELLVEDMSEEEDQNYQSATKTKEKEEKPPNGVKKHVRRLFKGIPKK